MSEGCVVGELIKLNDGGTGNTKAVEVFLAEGKQKQIREELDLWRWDDIKEEEEGRQMKQEDRSVQNEETGEERDRTAKLRRDFSNLMTGGGLLPNPPDPPKKDKDEQKGGWNWGAVSPTPASGMREIPFGSSPYFPRLEGAHVKHPCCGTVCVVLSVPAQNPATTFIPEENVRGNKNVEPVKVTSYKLLLEVEMLDPFGFGILDVKCNKQPLCQLRAVKMCRVF